MNPGFSFRPIVCYGLFLLCLLSDQIVSASVLTGRVRDASDGLPIAHVTVAARSSDSTTIITKSNIDGRYRIILHTDSVVLFFSRVGYRSQQHEITIDSTSQELDISLATQAIDMGVQKAYTRAYDPAQRIIKQAIAYQKRVMEQLENCEYDSYSRFTVVDPGKPDAEDILMIAESQTTSYWKQPGSYKEIITARRQTANIPAENNFMVIGDFLSFADGRTEIGEFEVVNPIAEDALEFYNYYLLDTIYLDTIPVFVLEVEPKQEYDPLYRGELQIADGSFVTVRFDGGFSRGVALPFLTELTIVEQYAAVDKNLWLPVEFSFSGQLELGVPLPGIPPLLDFSYVATVYSYQVNDSLPKEIFDEFVIEVAPDADDVDSATWAQRQTVPLTADELQGYIRIDSIENAPKGFWSNVARGALFGVVNLLYDSYDFISYNRVEGLRLGSSLKLNYIIPNFDLHAGAGIGIKDEKLQFAVGGKYHLWPRRRLALDFEYHNRVMHRPTVISTDLYDPSFNALLFRYDPFDYYREKGFTIGFQSKVIDQVTFSMGYNDLKQTWLPKRTDYGVFSDDFEPRPNVKIVNGTLRSITGAFVFDSRKMILNKGRVLPGVANQWVTVTLGGEYSSPDIFDTDFHFRRFFLEVDGNLRLGGLGRFSIFGYLGDSDWDVPPQRYFIADHNDPGFYFSRGMNTSHDINFGGDRIALVYAEHYFGKYTLRHLGIPFLSKIPMGITIHGGALWTHFDNPELQGRSFQVREAPHAYTELGFGLTNLTPFLGFLNGAVYFTWQLSDYDTEKFKIVYGFGF